MLDWKKQFILDTDVSGYTLSTIISQEFKDRVHPAVFHSRSLLDIEQNYDHHNKELAGVIFGFKEGRSYFLGCCKLRNAIALERATRAPTCTDRSELLSSYLHLPLPLHWLPLISNILWFLSLFPPTLCSLDCLLSHYLNTHPILLKWLYTQITKNLPGCLLAKHQTVIPANLTIPPLNWLILYWDTSAHSGPISCIILCTLFFCSLVSLYLTVPYTTHLLSTYSIILQHAYNGQCTLLLYFQHLPFQSAYLPVTLKNYTTNTSSGTRLKSNS